MNEQEKLSKKIKADLDRYIDTKDLCAKLELSGREFIIKEGKLHPFFLADWSDEPTIQAASNTFRMSEMEYTAALAKHALRDNGKIDSD